MIDRLQEEVDVIFVDNHDSFTFNLVEDFRRLGARVRVFTSDVAAPKVLSEARATEGPVLIVLSPGPGRPEEAGSCLEVIRLAKGRVPLFGVCLGHQAIVLEAGGSVEPAEEIVHGRASVLEHDGAGPFAGLASPLSVGRYHSLCTRSIPERFQIHASIGDVVMAVSDSEALQIGVQFHPESILTPAGPSLIAGVLSIAREAIHHA